MLKAIESTSLLRSLHSRRVSFTHLWGLRNAHPGFAVSGGGWYIYGTLGFGTGCFKPAALCSQRVILSKLSLPGTFGFSSSNLIHAICLASCFYWCCNNPPITAVPQHTLHVAHSISPSANPNPPPNHTTPHKHDHHLPISIHHRNAYNLPPPQLPHLRPLPSSHAQAPPNLSHHLHRQHANSPRPARSQRTAA